MAKVILDAGLSQVSGRIGDWVFRNVDGRTFVARRPSRSSAPRTEAQLEHQQRFRRAANYARWVRADAHRVAPYQEREKNPRRLFGAIVRDYMRAPEINEVDLDDYRGQAGDLIRVIATDDTHVTAVTVTLRTREGDVVEQGAAIYVAPRWEYRVMQTVPGSRVMTVEVTAEDLAGNRAVTTRMVGTP